MKISMLRIKNCLGIKELEFNPGKVTLVEGKEGTGKTSILESIQRFFFNKSERLNFVYSEDGEVANKAETYIDLDDGTTMKKYINKENKVTTTGIDKGGMSPKNPETFLKSLVSEEQLNPIKIINMPDKEFTEMVLSMIPIKVTEDNAKEWLLEVPPYIDFTKHGLQVCKDIVDLYFTKRTEVNRRVKDLSIEVNDIKKKLPEGYNPDDWRNVSLQEKYDAIKNANEVNTNRLKYQSMIDNVNSKISNIEEVRDLKIKQFEDEIQRLKADAIATIDAENKNVEIAKGYIESNLEIDIVPLEEDQRNVELMKSYIRSADELKTKEDELSKKETESQELTNKIEYMRTKPQMLLKSAEIPIDGITVDGQGNVLINGRPPINLSGGERIKFAVSVAKSTSGDLKIILINGFEALSPSAQSEFIQECEKDSEFQYIITKVSDGDIQITTIDSNGNRVNALTGELF